MCDEIDCDGCCDGDCCDNHDCCCATTSATTTMPLEGGGSAAATGDNIDHDCLFYLCCAGCFLCPLFYVGSIKRADEPTSTTTPVESARPPEVPVRSNHDDVTVAATALTVETENLHNPDSVNIPVPLTVSMDNEKMLNDNFDQNDPISSSSPMNRQ